jgi:uncharacterized protein YajQ (UPF0234 family)
MPSFDIVSEAEAHEVQNAYDQCAREIKQRYDFQGTGADIERTGEGFRLKANSEDRVKAIAQVLEDKFVKRKLSLKFLDKKDAKPAGGQQFTMDIALKKGVDKENAKKIVQLIKDNKSLKVTPAIQGDAVRVTGKKRDDLQAVIAMLRGQDLSIVLSFNNFRD